MRKEQEKGQSILEYAILLGVVVVALLIMQVFVKRGYEGGLKDSTDKMGGDAFSSSVSTVRNERKLDADQKITEFVATDKDTGTKMGAVGGGITGVGKVGDVLTQGLHTVTDRSGSQTMNTTIKTDAASKEVMKFSVYSTKVYGDTENITGE